LDFRETAEECVCQSALDIRQCCHLSLYADFFFIFLFFAFCILLSLFDRNDGTRKNYFAGREKRSAHLINLERLEHRRKSLGFPNPANL